MAYRTLICLLAVAVLGFAAYRWLEAGEEPEVKPVSPVTLQELLERVKKLEARVDQLEGRPLTLFPPHGNVPYTPTPWFPPGTEFPNGWQQREINGIRYYLVPLDSASGTGPKKMPEHR